MNFAGQIEKSIMKSIFNAKPKAKPNLELEEILSNFPFSFPKFCEKYCKVQNKGGQIIPFVLNSAQQKVFKFLLYLKNKNNNFKGLIVKYRQNGISTMSSAWALYTLLALKCNASFISNNYKNASNLYLMFDRLIFNFPNKINVVSRNYGHRIGINSNLVRFYSAEGDNIRGTTILTLINDELGERTDTMELQALAETENATHLGILTPKGTGNNGYLMYKSYKETDRLDEILFLPWFEFEEYEINCSSDFIPKQETTDYLIKYNLNYISLRKKAWLEKKINELKSTTFNPFTILNQEYPPNLDIGFEATADNCFCDPYFINLAFENKQIEISNVAILGIDVAGGGKDKTIMCIRKGDYAEFIELIHNPQDPLDFTNKAEQMCQYLLKNNNFYYKSVNVDSTGVGLGFVEILKKALKQHNIRIDIIPVHFSSKTERQITAYEKKKIGIKEYMYFEIKKWLMQGNVKLQNLKVLQEELLATQVKTRDGEEFILEKEEIKKKLGHSPDYADALALTFQPKKIVINALVY